MIKVTINKYGKKSVRDLASLIEDALDGDGPEMGAVEAAAWTARHCSKTIGELVNLLVHKQVITLGEALRLIGREHDDITLS
jgi:orotate phosphoribosyltransferase